MFYTTEFFRVLIITIISLIYAFGIGSFIEGGKAGFLLTLAVYFIGLYIISKSKIGLISLSIITVPIAIYFPTSVIYGYPTDDNLFALLNTNVTEIKGYLRAHYISIIYTLSYLVGLLILFVTGRFRVIDYKSHILGWVCLILSMTLTPTDIKGGFVPSLIRSIHSISTYTYNIERNLNGIEVNKYNASNIDVKVLIIGESVRRDYMSCYGYPKDTTPFLNHAKGIFLDNYIAPAPTTRMSLGFSFFLRKDEIKSDLDYNKNILNIAKAAGYQITWISNHGRNGFGDELLYDLASLADERLFLKEKEFYKEDHDDFEMISLVKKSLKNNKKQLIIIHMIGSHEPTCSRVKNFDTFGNRTDAECYVSSIYKLDNFIRIIWNLVNEHNKNSELMYFSDHGLSVSEKRVFHDFYLSDQYKVPFFVLNKSNDQIHIKNEISGFNFINIFASWLGCKAPWIYETNILNSTSNFNSNKEGGSMIYIDEYLKFESLQREQAAIYPTANIDIKDKILHFKSCSGNIDQKTHGYINGWLACKKNNKFEDCGQIGVFFLKKGGGIEDYFICNKRHRPDVNQYLSVLNGEFGFEGYIRSLNYKPYIGYFENDGITLCDNLNIE